MNKCLFLCSNKLTRLNIFLLTSLIEITFDLNNSKITYLTPYFLFKSRNLLSKDNFNSFLPTIRVQQFSDSFKGFTFLVENRVNNEIENVFIFDNSNILKKYFS